MHSTDYRAEAMHAYVMAAPGETTHASMKALKAKIAELAEGFEEGDEETVDHAIDLRLDLAGVPPPAPPAPAGKVGRNDPCPCGSGKKYKKCCGA